jgi:hypothetical protein
MNPDTNPFVATARLKAAATIIAMVFAGLLCAILAAELTSDGKAESHRRGGRDGIATNSNTNEISQPQDMEASPDAVLVHILSPPLVPPPAEMPSLSPSAVVKADNQTHQDPPPVTPTREINVQERTKLDTAASVSQERNGVDAEPEKKPNGEFRVAVKCTYDDAAVQKSLQAGWGELVAVCRRPGAQPTLVVIGKTPGGAYQLRKTAPADNLANLGLRLASLEGELPGLEHQIRAETGVEEVIFYFAPSANFARQIAGIQQAALDTFLRTHRAVGTVVLSARLSCTPTGSPNYEVTGISMPEEAPANRDEVTEPAPFSTTEADARHLWMEKH